MKYQHLLGLALAAAAFAPSSAVAAVNITGIGGNPGFENGTITHTPSATNAAVGVGRFELTGTDTATGLPVDFLTYCVDILHHIGAGSFTIVPLSNIVSDPVKLAQLTALLTNTDTFIAGAPTLGGKQDISAAIQLAAWEILYEAGTNSYSLGTGLFGESGGNTGNARALAAGYLGNVMNGTWAPVAGKQVQVLYSANNQSQAFISSVPEPATWAFMIIGFGAIGASMRSSRRRTEIGYTTA